MINILYIINFLSIASIFVLFLIPASKILSIKNFSLGLSFLIFISSLFLLKIPRNLSIPHLLNSIELFNIPGFHLQLTLMLDSLSIMFIILTTFLNVIVVLASRTIKYRVKEKNILLFLINFLLINCFTTPEILLFYFFFEIILIPVFLLIGIWGSQKNKMIAASQFFLYTLFGSFFMLSGILIILLLFGTTNIFFLKGFLLDPFLEKILFLLFFSLLRLKYLLCFSFMVAESSCWRPTAGSVLLAVFY